MDPHHDSADAGPDESPEEIVENICELKVPHCGDKLRKLNRTGGAQRDQQCQAESSFVRLPVVVKPDQKAPWHEKNHIINSINRLKTIPTKVVPGWEWVNLPLGIARLTPEYGDQEHDPRPDHYPVNQKDLLKRALFPNNSYDTRNKNQQC